MRAAGACLAEVALLPEGGGGRRGHCKEGGGGDAGQGGGMAFLGHSDLSLPVRWGSAALMGRRHGWLDDGGTKPKTGLATVREILAVDR
ncbi:MAG: hypothetical protein CAPSK01_003287 [Candidatus Accumulibacter vicinus]|uniref:Uncharacterized protein n=1 Tax=Candidatus Accumulibacter vicinus TaxID=2954382 RepID=A0A084XXH7_9PROT|nr:MAG: hypothetical protein CAPSK01_003287 [Candidatus Accumulibacter vicinus]